MSVSSSGSCSSQLDSQSTLYLLNTEASNSSSIETAKSPSQADASADLNLNKFTFSLQKAFNLTTEKASKMAQDLIKIQKNDRSLENPDHSIFIKASENFPHALIVKRNAVYALTKKIGEGALSLVYSAQMFPTTRHVLGNLLVSPSNKKNLVVKRDRGFNPYTSFSSQKRVLDAATGGVRLRGVDHFIDTFCDEENHAYSVNEKYQYNLSQAPFNKMNSPVEYMIEAFIDISRALSQFHKKDFIHGDIKGANILIRQNTKSGAVETAITDFDTLRVTSTNPHETRTTVIYLDPRNFGDTPLLSIINQWNQIGIQSKECDVYAFGLTIYRDFIIRYIQTFSVSTEDKEIIEQLIEKILHQEVELKNDDMLSLDPNDFYIYCKPLRKFYKYPSSEALQESLIDICNRIESHFPDKQVFKALVDLSILACEMRREDRSKRPKMQEIHDRLTVIYNTIKKTDLHQVPTSQNSITLTSQPSTKGVEIYPIPFDPDFDLVSPNVLPQDSCEEPLWSQDLPNPFEENSSTQSTDSLSDESSSTQSTDSLSDESSSTQPSRNLSKTGSPTHQLPDYLEDDESTQPSHNSSNLGSPTHPFQDYFEDDESTQPSNNHFGNPSFDQ